MIHGDCSSRGCYAMTDEQIGEIYSLARESFLGGQHSFQIQAYPFRMTPANMARHRTNPNMAFWKMIKEGNDHFEATHLEPKVDVCDRHYVFDAAAAGRTPRSRWCSIRPAAARPTSSRRKSPARRWRKSSNDDAQYAQLVRNNMPAAPIRTGLDGGMNRVFLAQVGGNIPPAQKTCRHSRRSRRRLLADNGNGQPTAASGLLGGLFGSTAAAEPAQVAATDTQTVERGEANGGGFFNSLFASKSQEPVAPAPPPVTTATVEPQNPNPFRAMRLRPSPKPKAEPHSANRARPNRNRARLQAAAPAATATTTTAAAAPKPKPASQQQEANAAAPPAAPGRLINGAQAVVPSRQLRQPLGRIAVIRNRYQ